ncbi:glycosyltransferase [Cellulophaga sp. F20128]|uniref:glycosyltransferase n=1 Tax=Cellulophaga sp. F20128 TaxID=2926413 RepID=UPI001FF3533F|nr:glycosyltransferase [Cellulophaga sp. F20128]MCK0156847.1 glycosyltransferase [Cellulophaga sp. F20128]
MKDIAFVIESLQCGGAEKSLVTLLNVLDYNTFNVDLILFKKGGEFEKFVPKQVVINYIQPQKESKKIVGFYSRLKFWIKKKVTKQHVAQSYWGVFNHTISNFNKNYDIAIAYNQGFATYYTATKMSAKIKFAWLNTDYKNAGYHIKFDLPYYNCYNNIVCVSKESELSLNGEIQRINKNKLPTIVIKDISDQDFINKMSIENTGFNYNTKFTNILTVGRLAKAKGYHLAVESCNILVNKGYPVKWYVIGDGPQRNDIENLIKDKNLQEHFFLLGFKENPYPFMKTCNLYVQTSLFEGLGLTVIEATILNKPIVTTNFPTATSIIEHGKTGLICDMNANDISMNIQKYLDNDLLKDNVIKNLSLLKNNDKEQSLKKVNELLNNCI